jgi:hypothetical protein
VIGDAAVNSVPNSVSFRVMSQSPADIVLRNRGEGPAQLLATSVVAIWELAV